MTKDRDNRPLLGILCMSVGMFCISINDMAVKTLSGGYPLHEIVLIRSVLGLAITLAIVPFEGGYAALRVGRPGLHAARVGFIIFANSAFYAGLVAMPLATASALYFVAPLFVTLLAIPVLGERVGPRRIGAVVAGFAGVLVILGPELGEAAGLGWVVLLPILAAGGYAAMSVLTRKLGAAAPASVLSFWIQVGFIGTGLAMFVLAGDGRLAAGPDVSESARFLLRAWIWPRAEDLWIFGVLGLMAGTVGYTMSQAYRLAAASTVAPFELPVTLALSLHAPNDDVRRALIPWAEYTTVDELVDACEEYFQKTGREITFEYLLLLYAVFWGWTVFGEWPRPTVFAGAAIIVASGVYIVLRDRHRPPRRRV